MTNIRRGREARAKRRESAQKRQGAGTPEPQRQLEILDERLGVGVGAAKERARLTRQIVVKSGKNIPFEGKRVEIKKGKKS